jgi:hypothetical protein
MKVRGVAKRRKWTESVLSEWVILVQRQLIIFAAILG